MHNVCIAQHLEAVARGIDVCNVLDLVVAIPTEADVMPWDRLAVHNYPRFISEQPAMTRMEQGFWRSVSWLSWCTDPNIVGYEAGHV
jgi:hypothetical protein